VKPCMNSTFFLGLISGLLMATSALAAEPTKPVPVISPCDKPFMFGFGSWEEAKSAFPAKADGIHIGAKSCQGGAGIAGLSVSVGDHGDWSPTMTLAVTEQNQAATLNLHLGDADGTSHAYRFDLRKLKPGQPQTVIPEYGASLAEPLKVEKAGATPGLSQVSSLMVIGDWSEKPADVVLSRITLAPPTDELRAQRAQLREIKAKEAEQARKEAEAREKARKELLEKGARHPADGPEVKHVCAVAPGVIAITLPAGQHVNNQLVPYVAEPGDEVVEEEKDKPRHTVKDGKVVDYFQKGLFRKVNSARTKVGLLSPDGK